VPSPQSDQGIEAADAAAHSPAMEEFFASRARGRMLMREIALYLLETGRAGIVIGLVLAGGAFALAIGLYTLAEVLFVLGIALFVVKAVYDFRTHVERKAISKILVISGFLILISVFGLFEWNRPQKLVALDAEKPITVESLPPMVIKYALKAQPET
jgi:hypothetical protein